MALPTDVSPEELASLTLEEICERYPEYLDELELPDEPDEEEESEDGAFDISIGASTCAVAVASPAAREEPTLPDGAAASPWSAGVAFPSQFSRPPSPCRAAEAHAAARGLRPTSFRADRRPPPLGRLRSTPRPPRATTATPRTLSAAPGTRSCADGSGRLLGRFALPCARFSPTRRTPAWSRPCSCSRPASRARLWPAGRAMPAGIGSSGPPRLQVSSAFGRPHTASGTASSASLPPCSASLGTRPPSVASRRCRGCGVGASAASASLESGRISASLSRPLPPACRLRSAAPSAALGRVRLFSSPSPMIRSPFRTPPAEWPQRHVWTRITV
mmetsp:Transcript_36482/g.114586  ORF Transcript_36482/g.114586 Transcript_36482/m.114586 type:complete len:332 (+) Transcript_36482:1087-2082(+)